MGARRSRPRSESVKKAPNQKRAGGRTFRRSRPGTKAEERAKESNQSGRGGPSASGDCPPWQSSERGEHLEKRARKETAERRTSDFLSGLMYFVGAAGTKIAGPGRKMGKLQKGRNLRDRSTSSRHRIGSKEREGRPSSKEKGHKKAWAFVKRTAHDRQYVQGQTSQKKEIKAEREGVAMRLA